MSLDLNALSATDADVPTTTRANKVADSPFPGWVKESFDSDKGKAVDVPRDAVREVMYAVRQAGIMQGLGTRIVLTRKSNGQALTWVSEDGGFVATETDEGLKEIPQNTVVRVIFKGQPKRTRRTREEIEAARADGESVDEDSQEHADESAPVG